MYNLKHLLGIARVGLGDMMPAVRQAFNDDQNDDRLDQVFGQQPRYKILGITAVGLIVGEIITYLFPNLIVDNYIINEYVNWSAVVIGVVFALLYRRYLFQSGHAREGDFPWLAAALVPAALCIALIALIKQFATGSVDFIEGAPVWAGISALLIAVVNSIGVIAALTIAVAALCFSRDWVKAAADLAVQLLVFKIMVWVTILVVIDIGFVGQILASVIESVFGIRFPSWLSEFVDQLTLAALLSVAYGAIIGAVWTVCQENFGVLLKTGEVRIVKTLANMTKAPKEAKKEKKKTKKTKDEPSDSSEPNT